RPGHGFAGTRRGRPRVGRSAGGRSQRRLPAAGPGPAERLESAARIGGGRPPGGGEVNGRGPGEGGGAGAGSPPPAAGAGAGAPREARKPKAGINAMSKAVRISDVSPISPPLPNGAPDPGGGAPRFQQLRVKRWLTPRIQIQLIIGRSGYRR